MMNELDALAEDLNKRGYEDPYSIAQLLLEDRKRIAGLVPLEIMGMRECGQEAVFKETGFKHNWKEIRIVCEAIWRNFGLRRTIIFEKQDLLDLWMNHKKTFTNNYDYNPTGLDSFMDEICEKYGSNAL